MATSPIDSAGLEMVAVLRKHPNIYAEFGGLRDHVLDALTGGNAARLLGRE